MITNIDCMILRFMESVHNPLTDSIFSFITWLGDDGKLWIGLALILIAFFPKHRKTGIAMIIGLIVFHFLCNGFLKDLFGRPRPYVLMPDILNSIPDIDIPSSYSMPSGHTMMSFVCAEILGKNIPKMKLPAYIAAVLMGLSRIYLLVHYPTDVIVGAVLGVLLAMLINYLKDRFFTEKTA